MTSNPAIFEKAILGSSDYDDQLAELASRAPTAARSTARSRSRDVGAACDVLRPVYDERPVDGYVSLEVEPDLAFDTDKTIAQAREYWEQLDRPNVMIKIPGTPEGVPAIEQATYEGINVNVTLLFSVEAYAQVAEAYIRGPGAPPRRGQGRRRRPLRRELLRQPRRHRGRQAPGRRSAGATCAASPASPTRAPPTCASSEIFEGDRFAELRAAGAHVQRPLWASTGVKDPRYPDTLYVDALVAPDTVNTMPMDTLIAVGRPRRDPGRDTALEDPTRGPREARARPGIDMEDVTDQLLRDGVDKFVTPMDKLLAGIESKREAIVTHRPSDVRRRPARRRSRRPSPSGSSARAPRTSPAASGPRTRRCGAATAETPELADRLAG